jgi:hypothetical protein
MTAPANTVQRHRKENANAQRTYVLPSFQREQGNIDPDHGRADDTAGDYRTEKAMVSGSIRNSVEDTFCMTSRDYRSGYIGGVKLVGGGLGASRTW